MTKVKKIIFGYGIWILLGVITIGAVFAAFSDKRKVLGSSFSVGNAEMRFLADLGRGTEESNLVSDLPGPSFTNIGQNWQQNYPLKIVNTGSYKMALGTHSIYETINDPDELRSLIYCEIFSWDDTNGNGTLDSGELGESFGKKTIIKWKTEGFNLGEFEPGQIKSLILQFSTDTVSDTKEGKTGTFDFEFEGLEL